MKNRLNWRTACAVTASASGVCFASGRTAAFFFMQTGRMSWFGVFAAALVFGALTGGICALVQRTGAHSVCGMCARAVGVRFGAAVCALHMLLTAAVALAMLNAAGKAAALSLPVHNAYGMGALGAAAAALFLCLRNMRGMDGFGRLTLAVCGVFFAAMALDPSEVRFLRRFETVSLLENSAAGAAVLGMLFGALCALVCADAAVRRAGAEVSPARFGFRCGLILLGQLLAANAALLRGGKKLLSLAEPMAALAARWGKNGFYACITVMFLCAAATLAACAGALANAGMRRRKMTKKPC